MKKTILPFSLVVILALVTNLSFAKIWRVNNNVGQTADFVTIQAAADAATAGDTIYLESSIKSYGDLSTKKKIIVFGVGYFLNENANKQAVPNPSTIDNLKLDSDAFSSSAGSTFTGVSIAISTYYQVVSTTTSIIFQKCIINGPFGFNKNAYTSSSGSIIKQCILNRFGVSSGVSNIICKNNIIGYPGITFSDESFNSIIQNNIFISSSSHLNCAHSVIRNNIFCSKSITFGTSGGTANDNVYYNNITANSMFGSDNGNQANVNPETLFVCSTPGTKCGNYSTDGAYVLSATSAAKGAGLGGEDCGIFGGTEPYVLSGIPALPTIYYFMLQNTNTELKVDLKIKSY